MNGSFLFLALRQTQTNLSNPRLYAVFGIVVFIFAISGPFGTLEAFSLPHRFGIWFLLHAAAWFTAILSLALFDQIAGKTLINFWAHLFIGGVFAGFPVSLTTMVAEALLRGQEFQWSFEAWGSALTTAIPLTLAFSTLSTLAAKGQTNEKPFKPNSALSSGSYGATLNAQRLMQRLPVDKRGALISLSAADHYVEINTGNGKQLLLMRLSDAVTEANGTPGRYIHRSHWVADHAIVSIDGSVGKAKIRLIDGRTLPVSRAITNEIRTFLAGRTQ